MAEIVASSERLRLRTWDDEDADRFYEIMNTPGVMRWLGGLQTREQFELPFQRIKNFERDYGHTLWLVEDRASTDLLGFCGLKRVNSPGTPMLGEFEVGWRLRESAWGKGYAKEAAILSLDLAFNRFDAPHVVALTVQCNEPSWRLMERLGMNRRADLDFIDPRFGDELNPWIVYRIDAEEWADARTSALA